MRRSGWLYSQNVLQWWLPVIQDGQKKRRIVFFSFSTRPAAEQQKFELLLKELPNWRRNYVTTESLEPPRVGRRPAYKTNLQKRERTGVTHTSPKPSTHTIMVQLTQRCWRLSPNFCVLSCFIVFNSQSKIKWRKKRHRVDDGREEPNQEVLVQHKVLPPAVRTLRPLSHNETF